MQTSDQQQRIITHLKLLREQSLSEYLGTNLQSLANKQVIEDILKQFISVHEQQFLTTITNTIMQVKQQYRAIKKQLKQKQQQQSLVKIKTQNEISQKYEKQMEVFFQKWMKLQQLAEQKSGERNPMKAINKLFEQISKSVKSIQDEKSSRARVIQQCQQQKKRIQSILGQKQLLQTQIVKLNQINRANESLNKQLQQEVYQKHMKVDELMVEYKLLQKELTQLESVNLSKREAIDYMESNAGKMREQSAKLRQDIQMILKEKQTLEDDNNSLITQINQLRKQIDSLRNDIDGFTKQIDTSKKEIDNLMKQIDRLKNEINGLKNEISGLENKIEEKEQSERVVGGRIEQLNKKCLDILQENGQLKQTIYNSQKQITTITSKHQQQRLRYEQIIRQKQQQQQQLQNKLQSTIFQYTQQLQTLTTKLTQQKEHSQHHSHQLTQQHCQKLSLTIQQKDNQLKQYIDEKDKKIAQIQQELKQLKAQAQEREYYQRQYQLYLQEIVQLKEKIRVLQPVKYQQQLMMDGTGRPRGLRNKRSKIYFLLTQVHVKLQTLRQQNMLIAKSVKQHLISITSYCNKSIQLITARVLQTKLSCDYCDHHQRNYAQTKVYNNNNNYSHRQQQKQPNVMIKPIIMGNGNSNNNSNSNKYPQAYSHGMHSLSFGGSDNQRYYLNQKQQYESSHLHQNQGLSNVQQRFGSTIPRGNLNNTIDSNNTSSSMLRNVKKMNEKMKFINHQNSSYQLHLTRILSEKTINNPYQ